MITWNSNLKFVLSDVDETVADLYMRARPDMCRELDRVLAEGTVIFFITGQSLQSVQWRITDHIRPDLRARVLIAHCSGAEVWGFDSTGSLRERPFYSLYENALSESQKQKWREVVQQVIEEFALNVHRTMPVEEFKALAGDDPAAIMLEDRGPQITFEVVNGYNTPQGDMRVSIAKRLGELFVTHGVPVTARLAGVFAVDTALSGVSKTTAITKVLEDEDVLHELGLSRDDLKPEFMEVWGDKFSIHGGTDRHMSEALPMAVRSIDFRQENPSEFLEGYHTVLWDGTKHLHDGLLEFLHMRPE